MRGRVDGWETVNSECSAENTCKAVFFRSTSLIDNSVRKQECDALLYLLIVMHINKLFVHMFEITSEILFK